MRRAITAVLGFSAAAWVMLAQADVTVLAVRLGANDVVALAKFYDAAFGLKEIDQRRRAADGDHHALRRHGRRSQSRHVARVPRPASRARRRART